MTRSLTPILLSLAAATALLAANPCTAQSYTLAEIPVVSPTAINNNGQIGGADPATGDPSGNDPFILSSNGTLTDLGNLGSSCGVYGCRAVALNSLGDAVGLAGTTPGSYKPFLFSNGKITQLAPDSANPLGLNGSDDIVGYFYPTLCDSLGLTHAFVIKNGVFTDLSQPTDPSQPCNIYSEAHGINTSGQIAGASTGSNNPSAGEVASVWQPTGALTFLGVLGTGFESRAFAINDAGQVTGNSYTGDAQGSLHAFLFSNGTMTDIDTFGSIASWAFGINSNGVVVGQVANQPNSMAYHAFVFMGGSMMDLNTLIPAGSGLTIYQANAINDAGDIVAFASSNSDGTVHGVLLKPVAPQITSISPTSGVAGTLVTITGKNFTSKPKACSVTINGKLTKWTTWSNTKIQVQVPSGLALGTGHVVVTAFFQHSKSVAFTVK
jgi:probable HAF family extracellular repeat protein